MEKIWQFLVHEWWKVVVPLGVFLLCLLAGFILRRILFKALKRWSERTHNQADEIIIQALRGPIIIWSLILGADLAMRSSVVPARYVHQIDLCLLALWIISLTIIASQLAGNLVRFYGTRVAHDTRSSTLTRNLVQLAVVLIGLLILMNHVGIDIRPLLTALGVGGLAVALALQDTLSNLFAGFYTSVAGQIRLGDYIRLNTGEEGYVHDITWRSTTLRALGNNLIFVPNAKLAQAIVTNYDMPDRTLGISVNVRVPYDSDLDLVERVLLEEAKDAAASGLKGLVPNAEPSVALIPGFGDSSLVLSLNLQASEFVEQYGIQSEMRRRIFKRFRKEGIPIALPAQTVVLAPSESETAFRPNSQPRAHPEPESIQAGR